MDLLTGKAVGASVCHIWYDDGKLVQYNGKVVKVRGRGKRQKYVVSYWAENETFEDAADYEMSPWALGADLIGDDLTM